MFKNNSKDICTGEDELNYAFLSLISKKIHVGVIGSGRAGMIKTKHFLQEGVKVTVISKDLNYDNKSIELLKENNNFKFLCREYTKEFIFDKHLIIIAVNDENIRKRIKEDCDDLSKIYIDCTNFKEGLAVVPVQRNSKNVSIGVNTRGGNPKASIFIAKKTAKEIEGYDDFVSFTTMLRNKFKELPDIKDNALKFIFSDDFYFFFEKGKAKEVIKLFYDEV